MPTATPSAGSSAEPINVSQLCENPQPNTDRTITPAIDTIVQHDAAESIGWKDPNHTYQGQFLLQACLPRKPSPCLVPRSVVEPNWLQQALPGYVHTYPLSTEIPPSPGPLTSRDKPDLRCVMAPPVLKQVGRKPVCMRIDVSVR